MPTSLLDNARFLPLANLVAEHGIRFFVETNAHGDATGLEAAQRLNLEAHVYSDVNADALWSRYEAADVCDGGDPLVFLNDVLPKVGAPAFFWLDPSSPTHQEELALIERASAGKNWFVDVKPLVFANGSSVAVTKPGEMRGVFDKSETFDTHWAGPEWMKPRVYRTQSEKDTWYAVAVENEYKLPDLKADDVVVDIGAHIGSFSWLAYQKGSRRIYAFEVDPWHYDALLVNAKVTTGIEILHGAVVRGDVHRKPQYRYAGKWNVFGDEGEPVQSFSLDDILTVTGPVRFLKTDCEGHEFDILYTATRLDLVDEIAGEYHESAPPDDTLPAKKIGVLCKFLSDRGFLTRYVENAPGIGNFSARRSPWRHEDNPEYSIDS